MNLYILLLKVDTGQHDKVNRDKVNQVDEGEYYNYVGQDQNTKRVKEQNCRQITVKQTIYNSQFMLEGKLL